MASDRASSGQQTAPPRASDRIGTEGNPHRYERAAPSSLRAVSSNTSSGDSQVTAVVLSGVLPSSLGREGRPQRNGFPGADLLGSTWPGGSLLIGRIGRSGCELWAARHEARLRREVAQVLANRPRHASIG